MNFLLPNNRIYHYCSAQTALELILPEMQLRLSNIQNTNDPRENKSYFFDHHNFSAKDGDINNLASIDESYSRILRNDCKVLCFSKDKQNFWGCSFSKMWAHYADNHRGVCLEIDKEKFIEENSESYDFGLFKDVTYFLFNPAKAQTYTIIDHKKLNAFGKEHYLKNIFRKENMDYLFFTKNHEWSSEVEIRLIHFSEKAENEYCSIKNSLANVHVGINFHRSYLPSLKFLLSNSNAKIAQAHYAAFNMVFKSLE